MEQRGPKFLLLFAVSCLFFSLQYVKFTQTAKTSVNPTTLDNNVQCSYRVAFGFLLNRNPDLFLREFLLLYHPCHYYSLHIDAGESEGVWELGKNLSSMFPNVVLVQDRVKGARFTVSLVQMTLRTIRTLFDNDIKFDKFVLLSGEHYPIQNIATITQTLEYLPYENYFWFTGKYLPTNKTLYGQNVTVHKHSQWFVIGEDSCKLLLTHPLAKKLMTWKMKKGIEAPDEHVIGTALMNIPEKREVTEPIKPECFGKNRMMRLNNTYCDTIAKVFWPYTHAPSPVRVTWEDFPIIKSEKENGKLWIRKVAYESSSVLERAHHELNIPYISMTTIWHLMENFTLANTKNLINSLK